jgi:hypothetical protein
MFNIGKDADRAQALIMAYLKSSKRAPLGQLRWAEEELIRRPSKMVATWATSGCWHTSYRTKNAADQRQ